jgi:hypothetical protein
MAHEVAKMHLAQARNLQQRAEAVRAAISLGMPLDQIEVYLDWLDFQRKGPLPDSADAPSSQHPRS